MAHSRSGQVPSGFDERGSAEMVNFALRPITHVARWLVWHSTHISLLEDLNSPAPPRGRTRRGKAA